MKIGSVPISKKNLFLILFIFLCVSFIFLRLYKINSSIEFWGDIGRDNEKLMEWAQTGKPPLNGPNTILKIVNQSPWFFYVNYPVFLITKSPLTMTITLCLLSLLSFLYSFFILKNRKELPQILILILLIIFHPLFIQQQRTPWNPTFAIPFLLASIAGIVYLQKQFRSIILYASIFFLMMAIGMTYSIFPVVLILMILLYIKTPKQFKIKMFLCIVFSFLIVFLPNIIFELRHDFFLLKRFPYGLNIPPVHQTFLSKIPSLFSFVLQGTENINLLFISIFFVLVVGINSIFFRKNKESHFILFLCVALIATVFTLVMPFQQGYYLFGIVMLWFLVISSMQTLLALLISALLLFSWISPSQLNQYFHPSLRSVTEMNACAKKMCLDFPGNYYVTSYAWHGMHSAHDHAFFFNKNGCMARDIVSYPTWSADGMIVVADKAHFTPYKDSFYELEQFGPYTVKSYYQCSSDFQYFLLEKKKW